jgi:hypothetical protein
MKEILQLIQQNIKLSLTIVLIAIFILEFIIILIIHETYKNRSAYVTLNIMCQSVFLMWIINIILMLIYIIII